MKHLYDEIEPFGLFNRWLEEAKTHPAITEPTAMSLATMGETFPSVRIVLLKHADEQGFVFYTNMESRKSREIKQFPGAGLCFYWMPLDKQVRIVGHIQEVSSEEADIYFASRLRGKQIGAWASLQSAVMHSGDALEERISEMEKRFEGQKIPRPPHWSGWRVVPQEIEFWEQKEFRLHHRIRFIRKDNNWHKELLYP